MTILEMDHVGVIVRDLDAALPLFLAIGFELEGRMDMADPLADRLLDLQDMRSRFAFLRPPGGGTGLEMIEFTAPAYDGAFDERELPVNAPGYRHVALRVDDLDATRARALEHGATPIGEVVDFHGMYRLAYVRTPDGLIVEFAQRLGNA